MRFAHWTRALLMRSAHERHDSRRLRQVLQLAHRLETDLELLRDDVEHLKARQAKLGTRLGGALGGRPRAGAQGAVADQLSLESIPPGDKAALRAYFKLNKPKEH